LLKRYGSLFPGIEFGAAYKILQRIYKFGGFIMNNYSAPFKAAFGEKQAKTVIYATAGSIMGIGKWIRTS
jgi:hypothetical protein